MMSTLFARSGDRNWKASDDSAWPRISCWCWGRQRYGPGQEKPSAAFAPVTKFSEEAGFSSQPTCAGYGPVGYEKPRVDEFLDAMASSWQKTEAHRNTPVYLIRKGIPLSQTTGTSTVQPWGYPNTSKPMKMSAVLSKIDPSRTWAMTDVDQLHPDAKNASLEA